jgi:hypothetical protein
MGKKNEVVPFSVFSGCDTPKLNTNCILRYNNNVPKIFCAIFGVILFKKTDKFKYLMLNNERRVDLAIACLYQQTSLLEKIIVLRISFCKLLNKEFCPANTLFRLTFLLKVLIFSIKKII